MRQACSLGRIVRGAFASEAMLGAKGSGASLFGLAAIAFIALLALAPRAGAATVTQRPLLFTISGASTPDHPMEGGRSVAVDNATGALYFSEGNGATSEGRIFRYHADGTPWPFPSTGLPYLSIPGHPSLINAGVAVDNSGGANQSRIYAADQTKLYAFDPSGELLWTLNLPNVSSDVAVDPSGHPYVSPQLGYSSMVRKYANTGSPPALLESLSMTGARAIDVNSAGDVFLGVIEVPVYSIQKWVGGSFSSTLDPTANDVYVDQSSPTGPIFTTYQGTNERQRLVVDATAGQFKLSFGGAQTPNLPFNASESQIQAALEALPTVGAGNVRVDFTPSPPHAKQVTFEAFLGKNDLEPLGCENGTTPLSGGTGCTVSTIENGGPSDTQEYASNGTLLGTFGTDALTNAESVAYNPSLDRLYVMDSPRGPAGVPSVVALGSPVTGTAPDVTIEAPSAIGVATAHFSGTVNPQGTSSEWRFQWRKAGESWGLAASSPPQSLPADSNDHNVEYTTSALRGNSSYQVRLVAVNTANHLSGASEAKPFTTSTATQAPTVTIAPPSAIAVHGAKISGTVNPEGDTADWRVQISTDPACESGFVDQQLQSISPSSNSPVAVEYDLTGLLPTQKYCARILATNSAGSTTSEAKTFETLDALPSQVFAAFAAPRTDTSARINGYVNPEGSQATYRFEYSPDGSTWTTLPDMQTRQARRQIVVGSEVSGLEPSSTYHYRFTVESGSGSVQSDEKTFETRSPAEMQLPQRGIELVNKPEKGNQNIVVERSNKSSLVSADGNRVIWKVYAGAPGGTTGTEVNFLSIRTPSGWESQPLAPPAEQQVDDGGDAYKLNMVTPDFRNFLMRAVVTAADEEGAPPTFVRVTDQHHQDVLKQFTKFTSGQQYENADITDDGAHVILANPETEQLEEIGTEPNEVVSIMPDGQPAECGVETGNFFGSGPGASAEYFHYPNYHRMATTDASRLYFQAMPNGGSCAESSEHHAAIYYRDRGTDQTVEIDPGTGATSPALVRATPDGRSVIFVTTTSHSTEDENATADVYRWDAEGESYTCLTCVVPEAGVGRTILVSDDFSHVYFTSTNQLIPGHGMPGEENLYSVSDEKLNYVAPVEATVLGIGGAVAARLSPDGNVLLFETNHGSYTRLTADEQANECKRYFYDEKGPNCKELFRYEDSTNSLECLSCLSGGVTAFDVTEDNSESALSADGSTVAFVTREALLPEDINNAEDVYEWHNGALQLITDGETAYPLTGIGSTPRVFGMGANGNDIFYTVVQPGLTGYEQDHVANLYDARVGGGFPRPQPPQHCSEESCQGPLASPPSTQRIGSSNFSGPGNEAPASKGRCAAKRGKAQRRCTHKKHRKHKKRSVKRRANHRSDRGSK